MSMNNDMIRRGDMEKFLRGDTSINMTPHLEEIIARIPIAYDIDDVVAALQRRVEHCCFLAQDPNSAGTARGYALEEQAAAYRDAIKIVVKGGDNETD